MKIVEGYIDAPKGFVADGLHCGLKKKRPDIGWIVSETVASCAGVFTTNQMKAAPVILTKEALITNKGLKAIIVNSAIANACTFEQGLVDAKTMQQLVSQKVVCAPEQVAVASTGVIGETLPMSKIAAGIKGLSTEQGTSEIFHEAILTTDTVTKEIVVEENIEGDSILMAGVAKGSGMIKPNMATMLGFITTDACISSTLLQKMLKDCVNHSFNQITVDGDTSTNDMVLVMANGCGSQQEIVEGTLAYEEFYEMLLAVCQHLAKKIARDGEGATKLIEVKVEEAANEQDAQQIAKGIVGSSLVKTAIYGEDPNWGRIICAIGYSGQLIHPEKINLWIGSEPILVDGKRVVFDTQKVKRFLGEETVLLTVSLGVGEASGVAWGCDLTYGYVEINASYHT